MIMTGRALRRSPGPRPRSERASRLSGTSRGRGNENVVTELDSERHRWARLASAHRGRGRAARDARDLPRVPTAQLHLQRAARVQHVAGDGAVLRGSADASGAGRRGRVARRVDGTVPEPEPPRSSMGDLGVLDFHSARSEENLVTYFNFLPPCRGVQADSGVQLDAATRKEYEALEMPEHASRFGIVMRVWDSGASAMELRMSVDHRMCPARTARRSRCSTDHWRTEAATSRCRRRSRPCAPCGAERLSSRAPQSERTPSAGVPSESPEPNSLPKSVPSPHATRRRGEPEAQ